MGEGSGFILIRLFLLDWKVCCVSFMCTLNISGVVHKFLEDGTEFALYELHTIGPAIVHIA